MQIRVGLLGLPCRRRDGHGCHNFSDGTFCSFALRKVVFHCREQLLAEGFSGALDAFGGGFGGDAEELGGFADGVAGEIVEDDGFTGGFVEGADVFAQERAKFGGFHVGRVLELVGERVGGGVRVARAEMCADVVARDLHEPGREFFRAAELVECEEGLEKDVLREVVGLGRGGGVTQGADAAEVSLDEIAERIAIAGQGGLDAGFVRRGFVWCCSCVHSDVVLPFGL